MQIKRGNFNFPEKEFTLWVDSFLLSNNQTSDISPDEFAKI